MKSDIIAIFQSKMARKRMARGVIASFLGMLVMACSGCGGGGGGGGSAAPAAAPAPKPVSISQYGDSTTVGYYRKPDGTYAIYANGPVQMLQTSLQAQFGPTVTVQMHGVGGTTLADLLNGTGGFNQPLATAIKNDPSQIITLRFGLNDEAKYDVATYQGYLVQIMQILQATGKTIVLEELTPAGTYLYDHGQQYADAADQVAAQFGVPVVKSYSLTLAVPNWTTMMSDNQHPLQPLYQDISNEQLPTIVPIVQKFMQ